jgi:hypothetical protein
LVVIASDSAAIQGVGVSESDLLFDRFAQTVAAGLPRRFAPRNDGLFLSADADYF